MSYGDCKGQNGKKKFKDRSLLFSEKIRLWYQISSLCLDMVLIKIERSKFLEETGKVGILGVLPVLPLNNSWLVLSE